jgi:hypothetical protein
MCRCDTLPGLEEPIYIPIDKTGELTEPMFTETTELAALDRQTVQAVKKSGLLFTRGHLSIRETLRISLRCSKL